MPITYINLDSEYPYEHKRTLKIKARLFYFLLVVLTILSGLVSRSDLVVLPKFVALYAGDTLWALMVYWGFRMLLPARPIVLSACLALCFAFAIEFLQLFQIGWLDTIRYTKIGGLILGYGFKVSDLFCYTVGVAIGAFLDSIFHRMHAKKSDSQ